MTLSRLAIAAAVLLAAGTASADDHWVFLGTYTGKGDKDSKGIYRAKFDSNSGKLGEPELAAEMGSPSFLAIHPNKKFLYAVGEGGAKDGGPVVAFSLDAKTGKLEKLNELKSGGPGPCHVALNAKGDTAAVANYGGGSTKMFKVGADGKLVESTGGFSQHAEATVDGKKKTPRSHCIAFHPNGYAILAADLGLDHVKLFVVRGDSGLQLVGAIETPAGSGPRHLTIAPDGKFAYVCGELDSTVNVMELGEDLLNPGKTGKVVQSLSTLPNPVKGNSTAECILSPDGKFVYVSNRGHNSIAAFKVGEDRKLTAVGHITGDIKIPRNFNIDPTGKWMLIASQDGGKVGVWELDAKTGLGKETGNTIAVGRCVCVKFVPVAK